MPTVAAVPSLTLERRFAAPKAQVFAAWTQPEKLTRWFGPGDVTCLEAEIDARPGGRFKIVMLGTDGQRHEVGGTYVEVVPHDRLVFTWAWHSMPERRSLVTVRLADDGPGTRLTLLHEQLADAATRERHGHGWTGSLDKLAAFLAT